MASGGHDLLLDLLGDLGIFLEELPSLLFSLAKLQVAIAEPSAGAADDLLLHAEVEDVAFVADAVGVHHVEFGDAERRGNLVLNDLCPHALADDFFTLLELADAADIDPAGSVELQRPAAGRGFGAAEHDADLLADLVDEDRRPCRLLAIAAVSLRSDWLMSRACRPTCESPISPSSSFFGTRAATESMTITSTAFDLTSISVICMASSPLLGWLTSSISRSTPSFLAQLGSKACSASINAAMPPAFWASATTCRASVVLPLDSGPKTSMMRPRGMPAAAQGDVQRQAAGRDAFDRPKLVARQRHDRAFAELLFDGGDRIAKLGARFEDAARFGVAAFGGWLLGGFIGFGHTVIGSGLMDGAMISDGRDHE